MRHVRIVSKRLPKPAVPTRLCDGCITEMRAKGKSDIGAGMACKIRGDC